MFIAPTGSTPAPSAPSRRAWLVLAGVLVIAAVGVVYALRHRGEGATALVPVPAAGDAGEPSKSPAMPAAVRVTPDPAADADHDGLADTDEVRFHTDPNAPDTDGDGYSDLEEVYVRKTDPLKPDAPAVRVPVSAPSSTRS